MCITGAGSMFKLHFQEKAPNTYRVAYQNQETRIIINEILDYLFLKENIIMINTLACMFATTLTQKDVDRLSEALLRGLQLVKPKIEQLSNNPKYD
jgi:glutamate-1-semialdehyde 2,1-aminomutase